MTDIREVIRQTVAETLARRPTPTTVSLSQAAEMLEVSTRTIQRMNPPRSAGGRIPYSWVSKQLDK